MWGSVPFFRFLLPLISGILAAVSFPDCSLNFLGIAFFFLLLCVAYYFILRKNAHWFHSYAYGVSVNLFLFACGFLLVFENNKSIKPYHIGNLMSYGGYFKGRVVESLQERSSSYKTIVEIESWQSDTASSKCQGKVLFYLKKEQEKPKLSYGDVVVFANHLRKISPPQNPGEFDYKSYLSQKGIYHQNYGTIDEYEVVGSKSDIKGFAISTRDYFLNSLKQFDITGKEFGVISALIVGYKDELDKDLVQSYAAAGATHILAVSGLHVGIIYFITAYLFNLIFKGKQKYLQLFLLLGFLWFYALITGFSASVLRASAMFTFIAVAKALNKNTNIYNVMAASAFFLLMYNPFLIFDVGFQLSYLAVIGIVFLQPLILGFYESKNKWIQKVWELTSVTIAAQIITAPLTIFYFHQFPTYFLFSNLLVIPISTLIVYLGIAFVVLSPISILGKLMAIILELTTLTMNKIVEFTDFLPYSLLEGLFLSKSGMLLCFGMVLFFALSIVKRKTNLLLLGTFCLFLFVVDYIWSDIQFRKQEYFIVYNIKGHSAVELVKGKKSHLFVDEGLLESRDKINYHIKNNQNNLGIELVNIRDIHQLNSPILGVFEQSLVLNSGYSELNTSLQEPLILLVNSRTNFQAFNISMFNSNSLIVFDSSVPKYHSEHYFDDSKDLKNIHIVTKDGYCFKRSI